MSRRSERPHPLDALVGRWKLRGRTRGAATDDIAGRSTFAWAPDRRFLELHSEITLGRQRLFALEVIAAETVRGAYPAWVFSGGSGEPLRYSWRVRGRTLSHRGLGATFRGELSRDGRAIVGGWRPDDRSVTAPGAAYDAVMVRVGRTSR